MVKQQTASVSGTTAAPAQPQNQAPSEPPAWLRPLVENILREQDIGTAEANRLIEFPELLRRVPLSERTLREAIKRRQIPHIRLPGARRLLFDWESVRLALTRFEKGGIGR